MVCKMNKTLFVMITLCVLLSNCAQYDTYKAGASKVMQEVDDKALEAAREYDCQVIRMGAWQRKYDTAEKAKAWADFCGIDRKVIQVPNAQ